MKSGHASPARFSWGEEDVAIWDNRSTNHSASYGFTPHRRHAAAGIPTIFFTKPGLKKSPFQPVTGFVRISGCSVDVIATTQEMHARFSWGEEDVAIWDNRSTNHSASYGFTPHRRHAVRVPFCSQPSRYSLTGETHPC
jgi:hypothetical protein